MKKITFYTLLFITGSFASYSQNILTFTYDNAGNQTNYRFSANKASEASEENNKPLFEETISEKENLENQFSVSPNPTSSEVILSWQANVQEQITRIELVSMINSTSIAVGFGNKNSVGVNLSGKPTGLYIVIFHLNNPEVKSIQKKIIKL